MSGALLFWVTSFRRHASVVALYSHRGFSRAGELGGPRPGQWRICRGSPASTEAARNRRCSASFGTQSRWPHERGKRRPASRWTATDRRKPSSASARIIAWSRNECDWRRGSRRNARIDHDAHQMPSVIRGAQHIGRAFAQRRRQRIEAGARARAHDFVRRHEIRATAAAATNLRVDGWANAESRGQHQNQARTRQPPNTLARTTDVPSPLAPIMHPAYGIRLTRN